MELILPKWLCEELQKRTDFSLQNIIKKILIESLNNPYEGYALLNKVREKDEIAKYKLELDIDREKEYNRKV